MGSQDRYKYDEQNGYYKYQGDPRGWVAVIFVIIAFLAAALYGC